MFYLNKLFLIFILLIFSTDKSLAECQENILVSTPSYHFSFLEEGLVLDHRTELMWKKCVEGFSGQNCDTQFLEVFTWHEALLYADESEFADYTDWRLPNIKELKSIVEYSCETPSINEDVFPGYTKLFGWYWTSTPFLDNDLAWNVNFGFGDDFPVSKTSTGQIRLVRGGR